MNRTTARTRARRRAGQGFHNRRMARMHAETNRGVECGLGFAFRRATARR